MITMGDGVDSIGHNAYMERRLEDLLTLWTTCMTAESCRPKTIKQRLDTVRRFARRTGTNPIGAVGRDITTFLSLPNARTGEPLSPYARETYWRDLRAWFLFLEDEEIITANPMNRLKRPHLPRSVPRPLPDDVLDKIAESARGRGHLLAYVFLAALEGLRATEIAMFRGEQIEGDRIFIAGKGGIEAFLPAHRRVLAIAEIYPRRGWWFPRGHSTSARPHVAPGSVSRAVGRLYREHGITQGSVHRLRHSYGTRLLENGTDVRTVQRLMRHANLSTTAGYLAVTDRGASAAVEALPDL